MTEQPSSSDLQSDLRRVADDLGYPPLESEYEVFGNYDPERLVNQFGDGHWLAVLDNLGYDVADTPTTPVTDALLQADVRRVAEEVGHPPTESQYEERGEYSSMTVKERLGDRSWPDALEALGYAREAQRTPGSPVLGYGEPDGTSGPAETPEEALRADVQRVAVEIGHPPTMKEYNRYGEMSARTIAIRLGDGSWVDALDALGYGEAD